MRNKLARLIRKSTGDRATYRAAKKAWNKIPRNQRFAARQRLEAMGLFYSDAGMVPVKS